MAAEQGLSRRRGGLPPADDRAARAGQGRRAGQEGPAPRRRRLPRGRRLARSRGRVHRLRRRRRPRASVRGIVARRRRGRRPRARATRSSWCSTARPFYAEGGGQLADQGVIELDNGARLEVRDVQSPDHRPDRAPGAGALRRGHRRARRAGAGRRRAAPVDLAASHTATHMVHKAFREALGETATQAGSENSPGRFRFDFSATGAVPDVGDGTTSRRGSTTWSSPTSPCTPR